MLILQSRPNRSRRRLQRAIWIAIPFVVVAAWISWAPALTRYHLWKQRNALRQAREFIAKHDANNTHLALEVAFTVAPGNIDAWRAAADMLDQVGTEESVRIRQHIAGMMGATLNDQVALINCALRFHDFNAARDALSSIPVAQATQPAALGAALSFALATENAPVADALFDRLRKATPNNDDFKVAQAILHLRHPNPQTKLEARKELEADAANPKYGLRVERALTSDAMLRQDYPAAKRWAAAAAADPKSELSDRLQQANLELLVDKKPLAQVFPPLAARAAANVADIVPFVQWVLVQNHAAEANQWLATLPAAMRNSPPVLEAQSEVVAQLKDWDLLAPLLEAGAWGPIPAESVHLAMSARVVGARNAELQHEVWNEAIQAANGSLPAYLVLQRLANTWKWGPESEQTLWTIARAFPDQTWVHQELFNIYSIRKDTANMREVMMVLRKADPSIPRYQHDWALLTLLSNPTSDWNEPKQIMQHLYEADPANPNYATGYAFALAQAGKGPQSLAVVAKLSPAELSYTPRSPYLAYVYGLNRKKDDVARIENFERGTSLLPEERMLFTLAHQLEDRKAEPPSSPLKPKPPTQS